MVHSPSLIKIVNSPHYPGQAQLTTNCTSLQSKYYFKIQRCVFENRRLLCKNDCWHCTPNAFFSFFIYIRWMILCVHTQGSSKDYVIYL